MLNPALSLAAILLLAAPAAPEGGLQMRVVQSGQFSFHQRIIIRVPRIADRAPPQPPQELAQSRWIERKAAQCVAIETIAGAAITRSESVDLITADGGRLRARFDDHCPALDFYSGFYLKMSADGMVCAKRDAVRSRSGDACRIEAFKRLVLKR